ncbi:hypothetical protein BCR34DRAFT_562127 [Clohesyomyces aquaticus]|uniref:Uncharacterized protein n=1 Tax=Clohesyomyces aquaticus TaxID=1231657 RepID=A0A1Y1ZT33_9PLEO|nr:hypothetical protein BCR34DRAFT_562127 [Clohesyomyces aquaticus]
MSSVHGPRLGYSAVIRRRIVDQPTSPHPPCPSRKHTRSPSHGQHNSSDIGRFHSCIRTGTVAPCGKPSRAMRRHDELVGRTGYSDVNYGTALHGSVADVCTWSRGARFQALDPSCQFPTSLSFLKWSGRGAAFYARRRRLFLALRQAKD